MFLNRTTLPALLTLGLLSACSCESTTSEDASADVTQDGAADTPRDVWRPFDAPPRDDGPDLFDGGPTDPEWRPMPGLPATCLIERAEHPERLLDVDWLSCGEGCEYLAPDDRFQRVIDSKSGFHDSERGYFSMSQGAWDQLEDSRQRIIIMADTEGTVYGAWREPAGARATDDGLCLLSGRGFGPNLAQFSIFVSDRRTRSQQVFFFLAPLDEIGSLTEPTVIFDDATIPLGTVLQRPKISENLYVAELQSAGDLMLIRPDGTWERRRGEGLIHSPHVVGEDVFFEEDIGGGYRRLVHTRFGQAPNVLIEHESAHIAGATVTSQWITWQLTPSPGSTPTARRIDLYVSPFATTTEALEPRLLMNFVPDVVDRFTPQYGEDGWIASRFPGRFIRIDDGAVFAWPLGGEGPGGNDGFLWIQDGEVATAAVIGGDNVSGTVKRRQLTTLRPL